MWVAFQNRKLQLYQETLPTLDHHSSALHMYKSGTLTLMPGKNYAYHIKRKVFSVNSEIPFHVQHHMLIIYSVSLLAWMNQFMGKERIKFSPNDNPSLTSLEKTNGAPRWCFNITNYLGVPEKGTDVALRMRKGWGAGQGHHTPRLGSDKLGWLGVFTCPWAIKGRRGQKAQELWIKCYSTEGQTGEWGQGHWGSALVCLVYTVASSLFVCFPLFLWKNLLNYVYQWQKGLNVPTKNVLYNQNVYTKYTISNKTTSFMFPHSDSHS